MSTVPATLRSNAANVRKLLPNWAWALVFLGLFGGLGYVLVFSLANFVTSHPREIVVTIPSDQFAKPR